MFDRKTISELRGEFSTTFTPLQESMIQEWDSAKHPRGGSENKGQFSAVEQVSSGKKDKKGNDITKHQLVGGGDLPAHITKAIPKGWTDVKVSNDANSPLHVIGRDSKGREQRVYSASHHETQKVKKFTKTRKLLDQHEALGKLHNANAAHSDPKISEPGKVMSIIHSMGLRPGSEKDTGAEKQAYGATTLRGEHVVNEGGKTRLKFVGKKGVDIDLPVEEPHIAKMLNDRKKQVGEGKLFNVSDSSLRDYAHQHGGFNPKDYRTAKGTKTAREEVAKLPAPKSAKDKEKSIKQVATVVSSKLGNTPTIARESYIDPSVFHNWGIS